jgi:hypothetical protein
MLNSAPDHGHLMARLTALVTAILTLLAMQMSRLGPDGRKQLLQKLDADGALVRLGQRLCCESFLRPGVPNGHLH